MKFRSILALALATAALPATPGSAQAAQEPVVRPDVRGVVDRTVEVGAQRVHFLQAGNGPTAIILLHGWPQSSHEWRRVMPLLADRFTVIAPDLRGIGGTSAPSGKFDKVTLAGDVHALVGKLGLKQVVVAGHDIGGMVAYAYARTYRDEVLGVAVMDVPLPGMDPWSTIATDPRAWHFGFHDQKPLAEHLVAGHQPEYFRYFVDSRAHDPKAIPDADIAIFAKAYTSPGALTSGFEFYRAIEEDGRVNAARSESLAVPILLLGGERSMGQFETKLEASLRGLGATDVRIAVVPESGHWIAEENPQATAAALAAFATGIQAKR